MLEVLVNYICAFILAILGFYIIKKIIHSNQKLTIKVLFYLTINSLLIAIVHYLNYSFISFVINFIINTLTYKAIFNDTIQEAVIQTGMLSMFVLLVDTIFVVIQIIVIPLGQIQNNILIYLFWNVMVALTGYLIINIKFIYNKMYRFYRVLSKKDLRLNMFFVILVILSACGILYSFIVNNQFNLRFCSDLTVIFSLLIIAVIFINYKDTYDKLYNEYDVLLSNVQNFEEWIEKEQFTRHEYKNQLAVLYSLTTEKEVKKKIEEIIDLNLNIKNDAVNNLKNLPKGGLKGLLYYKTIIAEKYKINVTIDVSLNSNGLLNKMSKQKINTISKIIGIYYDNAIEAAKESRKKKILIEIYEIKDKVKIVISNTYNKKKLIFDNKKGLSSKGNNRGKGLYFAKRIIADNKWIQTNKEIIDNYYVGTITLKKHF